MDATSPVKRRVLGEINPNMPSPVLSQLRGGVKAAGVENVSQHVLSASELQIASTWEFLGARDASVLQSPPKTSPVKETVKKRSLAVAQAEVDGPRKKACPSKANDETSCGAEGSIDGDDDDSRERSASPQSPAYSTVSDNSEVETTQATNVTEPDAPSAQLWAPVPPRPGPNLHAPEQVQDRLARLRRRIDSRLKLASYKVESNQIDVPFENLRTPSLQPHSYRFDNRFRAGLAPGDRTGRVSGAPPDVLRAVVRRMEDRARAAMNRTGGIAIAPSASRVAEERRASTEDEDSEIPEEVKTDNSDTGDELPRLPAPRSHRRTPLPDRPVTPQRSKPDTNEMHLSSSARGAASLLSLRRS